MRRATSSEQRVPSRQLHPDLLMVEQSIAAALARGEALHPHALLFLLRLYQATDREDLGDLLGRSLAVEFDREHMRSSRAAHMSSTLACAAWLELLVDTSVLTDDERVGEAILERVQQLREAWASTSVECAAAAIGACLRAAHLESHRSLIPEAIDHLEQVVGRAYRPGQGIGAFGDHVRAAAALLTAHGLTGRLPYSMLAEELMLVARASTDGAVFATSCEGARVLCRLAALHDDLDYRRLAVVAPDVDYRRDAAHILESFDRLEMASALSSTSAPSSTSAIASAAIYGVARLELDFQTP